MRLWIVILWFVISVIGNPAMATSLTDDSTLVVDHSIFKPNKYFKVLESYVAEIPLASDHRPYVLKLKLK